LIGELDVEWQKLFTPKSDKNKVLLLTTKRKKLGSFKNKDFLEI
jgi:hypothetical protein